MRRGRCLDDTHWWISGKIWTVCKAGYLYQFAKSFYGPLKARFRFTKIGPEPIELIAPVEGETLYKQFLETNGEGIQHVAFTVDDLDRETKKMREKGIPVILSDRRESFAYFDTRKIGGIIIELMQSARSWHCKAKKARTESKTKAQRQK